MNYMNNYSIKTARRSGITGDDAYISALEIAYQACCQEQGTPSLEDQDSLRSQLQLWGPGRSGLEQKVPKSALKDKQSSRIKLVHLCYNLKEDHPSLSSLELVELMREECVKITRSSQQFAVEIAKAQQI